MGLGPAARISCRCSPDGFLASEWLWEIIYILELSSEPLKGEIKAHYLVRLSKKICFPLREGSCPNSGYILEWRLVQVVHVYHCALDLACSMKPWHGKKYLEVKLMAPFLAAAWIWGWLDKLLPLHFSRHMSKSILFFSLSPFLSGIVLQESCIYLFLYNMF